jgi:hypothetical protein
MVDEKRKRDFCLSAPRGDNVVIAVGRERAGIQHQESESASNMFWKTTQYQPAVQVMLGLTHVSLSL